MWRCLLFVVIALGLLAASGIASERRPSPEIIATHAEAGNAFWKADFVLCVTNYNSSIAWLSYLPFERHSLHVVLYIKQDALVSRKCADVDPAIQKYVTCKEVPNASGREAHTIAQFVYEYYDRLPRITVFAQDDCTGRNGQIEADHDEWWTEISKGTCRIVGFRTMSRQETDALAAKIEQEPFQRETCLCNLISEHNFLLCAHDEPFTEGRARCYQLRVPITFLWELVGRSEHLAPETVLWPGGAQFAAPAWALRSLPRLSYRILRDLLDGTRMPLAYEEGQDARLLYNPQTQVRAHPYTSFDLSHVCERAWFGLLNPMYVADAEASRKAHLKLTAEIAKRAEEDMAARAEEGGAHHHHGEGKAEGRRRLLALGEAGEEGGHASPDASGGGGDELWGSRRLGGEANRDWEWGTQPGRRVRAEGLR